MVQSPILTPRGSALTDLEKAMAEGGEPVETDLSRAMAAGGTPVDDVPIEQPKSFLAKAKDIGSRGLNAAGESFSNLGGTLKKAGLGALDLISPISSEGNFQVPFSKLAEAPYR